MKQEIHVDISPDGSLHIEAHGFTGTSCRAATAPLEQALGVVRSRQPKTESRRANVAGQLRNRLGGEQA
jgi:hypothetical protein